MKAITASEIESFIDERLANMQKRPLMYGSPDGLECQGFLLLETFTTFCVEQPIDFREIHEKFRREKFPKCPGPPMLAHWLQDKVYGLGMDDQHEVGVKIITFFIQLKSKITNL